MGPLNLDSRFPKREFIGPACCNAHPWAHQSKFVLLLKKKKKAEGDREATQEKSLRLYIHIFLRRKYIIVARVCWVLLRVTAVS